MGQEMGFMTEEERKSLIGYLFAEKCSCVIRNGKDIRVFRERGIKDLYRLLKEEPEFLKGAFVADKIVGKAAAALMILGGVKELFAGVVSFPALELCRKTGLRVDYTHEVPYIINRTQTDRCPLEILCKDLQTPEECRIRIEEFINMQSKNQ